MYRLHLIFVIAALSCVTVSLQDARAADLSWKLLSEKTVTGFHHPSSVACDIWRQYIYVADYGSKLSPTAADDDGAILKLSDGGQILDRAFLKQSTPFHRPRGLLVSGPNLWMADLNRLWQFDLKYNRSTSIELPDIERGDYVAQGYTGQLYVSDTQADTVLFVGTADFLHALRSQVIKPNEPVYHGGGIFPAAVAGRPKGGLYIFGAKSGPIASDVWFMPYKFDEHLAPIFLLPPEPFIPNAGRIGGAKWQSDDEILMTDWNSGALLRWTKSGGVQTLAKGFEGPSDICVIPDPLRRPQRAVAVADVLKGEVRILWFATGGGAAQ